MLFSEYVDGALDPHEKDQLQAFLAANPESAAQLMQFERTLTIVRQLPPHEPVLDMWAEFAPKMTEYLAEQKQPARRLGAKWADVRSRFSAGVILWTQALAERTCNKFGRYVEDLESE